MASQQVWGGVSDSETGDDDGLADGPKDVNQDQVQRSGKLLVLQQILPLWHEQVENRSRRYKAFGTLNINMSVIHDANSRF